MLTKQEQKSRDMLNFYNKFDRNIFNKIRNCKKNGKKQMEVARELGLTRGQVRYWWNKV